METRYFATGNYRANHRSETAHAMKNGERWAIYKAANEMAEFIPSNCVLIPIPSHTGTATYTLELCRTLAAMKKAEVRDILKGEPRETLYKLKKQGRHPLPKKLGFHLTEPAPKDKRVLIIDNVVATGTTAAAAVRAVGCGLVFAYAAATDSKQIKGLTRLTPYIN